MKTMSDEPQEAAGRSFPEALRDTEAMLLRRIRSLEDGQRSARRLAVIAAVLGLAAIAGAAAVVYATINSSLPGVPARSVLAREMVLVGPDGGVRGQWSVDDQGAARVMLADTGGIERLKLTVRANGEQGVSLSDASGRARVVVALLPDENATFAIADRAGQTRTVLGLSPDESSTLVFADRNGATRAALGIDATGRVSVLLPDEDEAAGDSDEGENRE